MATTLASVQAGFEAPRDVRDALAAMGRTEDVRFSPSGRRLAFACYTRARIGLAEVEVGAGAHVALTAFTELSSAALHEPHGVDFLDDDTLAVANRAGHIAVLPAASGDVEPLDVFAGIPSPGSIATRPLGGGDHELLVCNNRGDTVTRYSLADRELSGGVVVAHARLDLPDGLAPSADGRWLAVSSHNTHTVLIYDLASPGDADPVGVLRGARYPHGLRFADGDRVLLVADAGAPHVHVFAAPDGEWARAAYPTLSVRVMDDETFLRGRYSGKEGGPKGIDVHPEAGVVAVTAECLPLAFFDLDAVLEERQGPSAATLVGYELHTLEERARLKDAAAEARAQLKAFQRTKLWRLSHPARSAYARLRRLRALRRAG